MSPEMAEETILSQGRKRVRIVAIVDCLNALMLVWIFEWKCYGVDTCHMEAIPRVVLTELTWSQIFPYMWVYIFIVHGLQLFFAAELFKVAFEKQSSTARFVRKFQIWYYYSRLILDALLVLEALFMMNVYLMLNNMEYIAWFVFAVVKLIFRFIFEFIVKKHMSNLEKMRPIGA